MVYFKVPCEYYRRGANKKISWYYYLIPSYCTICFVNTLLCIIFQCIGISIKRIWDFLKKVVLDGVTLSLDNVSTSCHVNCTPTDIRGLWCSWCDCLSEELLDCCILLDEGSALHHLHSSFPELRLTAERGTGTVTHRWDLFISSGRL